MPYHYPENYISKENMLRIVLWHIFLEMGKRFEINQSLSTSCHRLFLIWQCCLFAGKPFLLSSLVVQWLCFMAIVSTIKWRCFFHSWLLFLSLQTKRMVARIVCSSFFFFPYRETGIKGTGGGGSAPPPDFVDLEKRV